MITDAELADLEKDDAEAAPAPWEPSDLDRLTNRDVMSIVNSKVAYTARNALKRLIDEVRSYRQHG